MKQTDRDYARIIEFLWNMEDSQILRYVKKKHIVKDFGMVRVLVPLAPELSPYDLVEVVGNYMPIYHVKQPKHLDRRWLDLALSI